MKKNELNMIGGISAAALFIGLFIAQIRFDAAKKKKWEDAENARLQRQRDDETLREAEERAAAAEKAYDAMQREQAQKEKIAEALFRLDESERLNQERLKREQEDEEMRKKEEEFKKPNPPKDKYKILLQTHGKYFIADDMQTNLGESRYHVIDDESEKRELDFYYKLDENDSVINLIGGTRYRRHTKSRKTRHRRSTSRSSPNCAQK